MQNPQPRVGVGVIVIRNGRVLLGERLGAHGAGTWAFPGGHLEFGESVEHCAKREVREETGLEIYACRAAPYTSDLFVAENKHYVTLFVLSQSVVGEPIVCEPTRCARWIWCRWSAFPAPLFQPLETLRRTGFVPGGVG